MCRRGHARHRRPARARPNEGGAGDDDWVDITSWNTAYLDEGGSAEDLLGEDPYGLDGDVVGEVENVIIDPSGGMRKVVIEGGGFLDIGDSHLAAPWDQVGCVGSGGGTTPTAAGNLDALGLFKNVEDMPAEPRDFRLSNLGYDHVTADGVGHGTVYAVGFSNRRQARGGHRPAGLRQRRRNRSLRRALPRGSPPRLRAR